MLTINDKVFEATKSPIIIEVLSYAGSAFGLTEQGEQVFINQRIVDTMQLQEGSCVMGYLMPNYPDKKDHVPWRAIRVETIQPAEDPAPAPAPAQEDKLSDRIRQLLQNEQDNYFTTSDLVEDMGATLREVSNACSSLHRRGLIARADVHSGPDQKRASFTLWAISAKTFAS